MAKIEKDASQSLNFQIIKDFKIIAETDSMEKKYSDMIKERNVLFKGVARLPGIVFLPRFRTGSTLFPSGFPAKFPIGNGWRLSSLCRTTWRPAL